MDTQSSVKALEMLSELLPREFFGLFRHKFEDIPDKYFRPQFWNQQFYKDSAVEWLEKNSNLYRMHKNNYRKKSGSSKNRKIKKSGFAVLTRDVNSGNLKRYFNSKAKPLAKSKPKSSGQTSISAFFVKKK